MLLDTAEGSANLKDKAAAAKSEGKCLQSNVIYQATVTTATTIETYVGLATNFKERYETISPPFDARTEEMKRNSQHIFGLYKTL